MATVRPTSRAREQIADLPFDVRESLDEAFTYLAARPRDVGTRLIGTLSDVWSMRVLEYRVLYRIVGDADQDVVVDSVRHRADAYPRSRH